MSFSFVVAGRIPMSPATYETWLDAPVPGSAIIDNPGDMFAGWYWDDRARPENWSNAPAGATPREIVATRDPEDTITLVRHERGALEAYLWTPARSGHWTTGQQQLLLMLAGAGDTGHVLFWEDASGSLPSGDSLLALLRGSRFVPAADDLDQLIDALRPAEDAFFEIAAGADD
ncbi:hypothetical protein ACIA8K_40875 [Catenuloplanes sp. NPDC051500]|uniref:hypothetical protein n=1 Tax=Catenuloplanes sp. NPDC051500 TaxID=3363959 RepID=UPI0037AA1C02